MTTCDRSGRLHGCTVTYLRPTQRARRTGQGLATESAGLADNGTGKPGKEDECDYYSQLQTAAQSYVVRVCYRMLEAMLEAMRRGSCTRHANGMYAGGDGAEKSGRIPDCWCRWAVQACILVAARLPGQTGQYLRRWLCILITSFRTCG